MLSNRLWLKRAHQDQDWYLVDTTSNDVIEVATRRREDVEIPTLRSTIRPSLTSTNVSVSFDMKLDRQDQHLIDTDKLNGVTDYKWIILYFISLNFYCLLKKLVC